MTLLAFLLACHAPTSDDTAAAVVDSVPVDTGSGGGQDCSEVSIRVSGNDPPVVGDDWTIFLWCDEGLLTGSSVVRFDPAEVARLEDNSATFVEAGEATLYMQVGRFSASRAVSVGEAP
jgi:hypothetical protein